MKPSHSHSESAQPLAPPSGQHLDVPDTWIHLHRSETSGEQHGDAMVGPLLWSLHVLRELSTGSPVSCNSPKTCTWRQLGNFILTVDANGCLSSFVSLGPCDELLTCQRCLDPMTAGMRSSRLP